MIYNNTRKGNKTNKQQANKQTNILCIHYYYVDNIVLYTILCIAPHSCIFLWTPCRLDSKAQAY